MRNNKSTDLLFDLIQIALNNKLCLSAIPSAKEWISVYKEALRQSVAGICLLGVERLMTANGWQLIYLPHELKLERIGVGEHIKQQNRYIDEQTETIWKKLKEDGLEAAILKGQGIATLYGELAPYRQSGDIDIWVKGGYKAVCDYVQQTLPTDDLAYHRFHYPYFEDTEVELHHRPTLMRNLLDDRKLAKWYNSFGADSFIYLENKGFAVPSLEFNRIFILTHIYRHFLFEGIGLRQIIDYYFVLRSDARFKNDNEIETLRTLKLMRFAEALMWILHNALGLEEKYLICGINEKEGRFVLSEILQTGNFGQADKRFSGMSKIRRMTKHGIHLLIHYPSEVIWTPIWLMFHKVWKWRKKRMIHKIRNT